MVVIDPLAILMGLDLSFTHGDDGSMVIYKGTPLTGVSGVWYRKPTQFNSGLLKVAPDLQDYAADALQEHCVLIRDQFPEARWISPYYAIKRANNKSLGLRMAQSVGLLTPATLFTSDKQQAQAFRLKYPEVIIKTLARTYPRMEDKGATMFFARKVQQGAPLNLDGLHLAPAVFQQAVDADYDIRATVVGDKVFPSKITNDGLSSPVRDWRLGHFTGTVRFEAYTNLPTDITEKCVKLTKQLGLTFSTIDLVRDKQGAYWFLETNPNGQWAFVDDPTADRIGAAIAGLLQGR